MFDLATAKTRLNITGAAQDVALQGALDAALALAESYCDRQFLFAAQRAKFYHVHSDSLSLRRYPIVSITAFTPGSARYKAHHVSGLIQFHAREKIEEVQIDYTGGYQVLPADLELALWQLFDSTWNTSQNAGQAAVAGAGAVQSITSEGQRISYFDPSKGSGGSGAFGVLSGGDVPFSVTAILDLYRRETV